MEGNFIRSTLTLGSATSHEIAVDVDLFVTSRELAVCILCSQAVVALYYFYLLAWVSTQSWRTSYIVVEGWMCYATTLQCNVDLSGTVKTRLQ